MKKRLLLALLPAAMILTACAGVGSKENNNLFLEDTLAHEEIFNEVEFKDFGFAPRRNLAPVDASEPTIGVQYSSVAGGKVSMRFIAAIKVDGANLDAKKAALAHTTAVWTRNLYDENGDRILKDRDAEIVSTKAYDAINSGGEALDIEDFGDGSYSFFVAYTMKNIPVATTSYLNVSLSIRDSENPEFDADSKIVAASIDGSTKFAFNPGSESFFLTGTIGGRARDVARNTAITGCVAGFDSADFQIGDTFLLVQKETDIFKVWGSSSLTEGANGTKNYFENNGGRIRATAAGNTHLYLNDHDEIWTDSEGAYERQTLVNPLFVRGTVTVGVTAWETSSKYELKSDRGNHAVLLDAYFAAGEFKIADASWGDKWNVITGGDISGNFSGGGGEANITCLKAGYYNIYINTESGTGYHYLYIFVAA